MTTPAFHRRPVRFLVSALLWLGRVIAFTVLLATLNFTLTGLSQAEPGIDLANRAVLLWGVMVGGIGAYAATDALFVPMDAPWRQRLRLFIVVYAGAAFMLLLQCWRTFAAIFGV